MKKITPIILSTIYILLSTWCVNAQIKSGSHDFYNTNNYPKLNYDSLFETATPISLATDGKTLFDNCLEAYGGEKQLDKIESLRFEWRLKAMLKKDSIDVVKTWARGGKHRSDFISADGTRISRYMIGGKVKYESSDSVYVMDRNRTILENFHYLNTALPIYLSEFTDNEIRYGHRLGDSLQYLYLQVENELVVALGINPQTHMIVSCEGAIIDDYLRLIYIYKYSDHALMSGFLVPQKSIFVSMGFKTGESRLVEVEVNPEIPDSYYRVK